MSATHPNPLDPYLRLRAAIENRTDLVADPALVGTRSTPGPLQHRSFRLQPGPGIPFGRQRAGDSLQMRQTITVHLSHDLISGDHDSSLSTALSDLWAAMDAILIDGGPGGLSGLVQPELQGTTFAIAGHQIQQTIAVQCTYSMPLSALEITDGS